MLSNSRKASEVLRESAERVFATVLMVELSSPVKEAL
jgi:hypothetical protein